MVQEINIYNTESQSIQKMCVLFQNKTNLIKLKEKTTIIRNVKRYYQSLQIFKGKQNNKWLKLELFVKWINFQKNLNRIDTRISKSLNSSVTIKEIESVIIKLKIEWPLDGAVG